MKRIMILIAMVIAMQVATAQTTSDGTKRSETEMQQKSGNQTASKTHTTNQMDYDQLIKKYGEMPYGSASNSSGHWRGLIVLLKLIFIGIAFASRGDSSANE